MKKAFALLFALVALLSFPSCDDGVRFTVGIAEGGGGVIVAEDGTEYVLVGTEGALWTLPLLETEFLGHIEGEVKSFFHMGVEFKTGMYSTGGNTDVLQRIHPYSEWHSVYVRSGLLQKEVKTENCIRFVFSKSENGDILRPGRGTDECERFLREIMDSPTAKEAGLYDLVRQPNGIFKNCYVYGYVYGILQEDLNVVIPMQILSFDDKAYSIRLNGISNEEYVLSEEWLERLMAEGALESEGDVS